ncbi:MAG TPA: electron transfer flavoprotein subunit alpha/FixB family protein [Mycobacteriales bacterium]|nr:electron transfer flavoprotein subunit alpha/FixB family protein [Mycobacteriales bacterium]
MSDATTGPTWWVAARNQESAAALLRLLPDAVHRAVAMLRDDLEVDVAGPALLEVLAPGDVVVVGGDQAARDLAGWLAAARDIPMAWAVDALRLDADIIEVDHVVMGGTYRLVQRLSLNGGAVISAKPTPVPGAATDGVRIVEVDGGGRRSAIVREEGAPAEAGGVSLTAAKVVVSFGRGIGGPDRVPLYRELAARCGAALGASRVAVDSGWIPFAHQVGQTGTAVAPEVYVAFGISGAVQHLAGMRHSQRVIAINTDPEAPICRVADTVIRADANEVAAAVLDRIAAG